MATKPASKAAAKAPTNVVAIKKPSTSLVSLQERMKADLAELNSKVAPASGDVIGITQDKMFKLPDGTKSPGPINLMIVDFLSRNDFYDGPYDANNIAAPACFAIGTNPTAMVPSDNAPAKQSDACPACPMNQFGSAGNGKACKNQRILAVLPTDADADTPLMVLKVSPTALKAFDAYVRSVAAQFQLPPVGVITEVSFDPNVTYASLRFGNPQPNENAEVGLNRREEARARLLTEPDVSQYAAPAPAGRGARAPAKTAGARR